MNFQPTKLLYLEDTYCFEGEGKFLGWGEDQKGKFLVFDQTIFYPQGGGQPSDTGTIKFSNFEIPVHFVGFNKGIVQHYYKESFLVSSDLIGQAVGFQIDSHRRLQNAKTHTAGHLLGSIVEEITGLIPAKGYHFQDGPHVQFEGQLDEANEVNTLLAQVNTYLLTCIKERTQVETQYVEPLALSELRLPQNFQLPQDKPSRISKVEGFSPVPCGGTHIRNLSEYAEIKAHKISGRKDPKISYKVF